MENGGDVLELNDVLPMLVPFPFSSSFPTVLDDSESRRGRGRRVKVLGGGW